MKESNEKLKDLISELRKLNTEDSIIKALQEINKAFLQNYYLEINGKNVYPIEVEIYYKDDICTGDFHDEMIHNDDEQKYRYGELYIHKTGRGGFDVVLSDGDYALSVLIRSAYVEERNDRELIRGIHNLRKQLKLGNTMKEKVLRVKSKPQSDEPVKHHRRISDGKYDEKNNEKYELNTFMVNETDKLATNTIYGASGVYRCLRDKSI